MFVILWTRNSLENNRGFHIGLFFLDIDHLNKGLSNVTVYICHLTLQWDITLRDIIFNLLAQSNI